ncbi:MAG: segregation ATPase FtsK/SpoIIIE, family, partial [Cryptosporangiaceae bacterium]|nr:segregation ATPase FtsK/SpoIIIE, family [Cryptosporangiaceae bacterium]
MQLFVTVADPLAGDRVDLVADVDGRTPVAALGEQIQALLRDSPDRSGSALLYVDGQPVDPGETVAESPIREGSLISLGDPAGCVPPEPRGIAEVRVIAGPDAGRVFRLGVGSGELGGDPGCWVPLGDPGLAPFAALLTVDAEARCWLTPAPESALTIEDGPVEGRTEWIPGLVLTAAGSLLTVAEYTRPDAAIAPSADGSGLDYNRPPRILPARRETSFALPAPPREGSRAPLPWLMALVPLVGAVAMTAVTGRPSMMLMAFLSPVAVVGNYVVNRRHGRRSHTDLVREYRERKAAIEADARAAVDAERAERRSGAPDPAAVRVIAGGPRTRLWERRRRDPDHLLIRAGTADLPSAVTIDDPERETHRRSVQWAIPHSPVTIPLAGRGVAGFAGPGDSARALGRWAVIQAAVLHSPLDLQIVVLTDPDGRESWDWVRWLPHARSTSGPPVAIGADADTIGRRIAWLLDLVTQRAAIRESTGEAGFREPDVLVVFDRSRQLRALPGVAQVLRDGPAVGVYALCLDASERLLPGECQAVVSVEGPTLRVAQAAEEELTGVRPDYVSPAWCAEVARTLAPLRDVSGDDDDAALPQASRLLDVLALDPPEPGAIAARWATGGRSTAAVIGESFDGAFSIDLSRDGPHGLIAGTTGSGKSELLQTIVASLAIANRPDEMTFVLVDYKGGSAFGDCVALPHTVGMVTDLDEHLVRRALASLTAELRRREHLLAAAEAKDIEDYQRRSAGAADEERLPRLLIVIDEFASMARDLPDFVTGLVNIAQRGRSLGIHLLLATQRPSGVVSPEIRANTNLRIALRVTDAAESSDVLNAPDAARIAKSTPGRAFVRFGHASLVPFQSARVGGRTPGAVSDDTVPPVLRPLGWTDLGRPLAPTAAAAPEAGEVTDLQVLVGALREAAVAAGVPEQPSPWLPALPGHLTIAELADPDWDSAGLRPIPYGVEDLPSQQSQRTAAITLASFGHLFAVGGPRTGRSQFLRTLAGSAARLHSTADLHLYGLDCGNGALLPLAALPHCGAVVGRSEVERSVRLVKRIAEEIRRRQGVLAAGGFADITEQRRAAPATGRLPHVLLLLDRWEGFLGTLGTLDGGALVDEVFTFLREGASVGVHLVITGDRSLLSGRIATLTEDKIVFRLPDRGDYSLAGLVPRAMPEQLEPGRAFRSDSAIELQVALLTADTSGAAQAAELSSIAADATARDESVPGSLRPFRLGELPSEIPYADAAALRPQSAGPGWVLAGVGGDQLTAYGPDLAAGIPAFLVAGPPKSGRSTALVAMARSAVDSGHEVIAVAPRSSPLRALEGSEGVVAVFTGSDLAAPDLLTAIEKASGRLLVV